MKVIVSPYWRKTFQFLVVLNTLFTCCSIYFVIEHDSFESFAIVGGCTLFFWLIIAWLSFMMRRLLTSVMVTELNFQSALFGNKQCCVDRKNKIYYMILECTEAVYSKQKFILLSNEPFSIRSKRSMFSRNVIQSYDIKKQILMPYNSDTSDFFKLSDWECITA
ncbi:MAG: hypothetical protein IJW86_06785 [Clostridia bacterium]|nr:hypothetical protein [Clostridia bacterium]